MVLGRSQTFVGVGDVMNGLLARFSVVRNWVVSRRWAIRTLNGVMDVVLVLAAAWWVVQVWEPGAGVQIFLWVGIALVFLVVAHLWVLDLASRWVLREVWLPGPYRGELVEGVRRSHCWMVILGLFGPAITGFTWLLDSLVENFSESYPDLFMVLVSVVLLGFLVFRCYRSYAQLISVPWAMPFWVFTVLAFADRLDLWSLGLLVGAVLSLWVLFLSMVSGGLWKFVMLLRPASPRGSFRWVLFHLWLSFPWILSAWLLFRFGREDCFPEWVAPSVQVFAIVVSALFSLSLGIAVMDWLRRRGGIGPDGEWLDGAGGDG